MRDYTDHCSLNQQENISAKWNFNQKIVSVDSIGGMFLFTMDNGLLALRFGSLLRGSQSNHFNHHG